MRKRGVRGVAILLALCLLINGNIEGLSTGMPVVFGANDELITVSGNDADILESVSDNMPTDVSGNDNTTDDKEDNQDDLITDEQEETEDTNIIPDNETDVAILSGDVALLTNTTEEAVTLPDTVDGYIASTATSFIISTKTDFENAQKYCAVDGFAGKTLAINTPGGSEYAWDMTDGFTNVDGSTGSFDGFGTADKPFQGTLKCNYTGGVYLKVDQPIIAYMGDNAAVTNLKILSCNSSATIAGNIVGENVTIANEIYINGPIGTSSTATSGAIAANIASGSTVEIANVTIGSCDAFKQVTGVAVKGSVIGVVAGEIGAECTVNVENMTLAPAQSLAINANQFGGVVAGKLGENSSVTVNNVPIAIGGSTNITGGVVGIFAGDMAQGSSISVANVNAKVSEVYGTVAGGLAGSIQDNAKVTLGDGVLLSVSGSALDRICVRASQAAGGFFGTVTGNHTWNLTDLTKLSTRIVTDGTTCYGGQYAGKLISSDGSESKLTITGGNSFATEVAGTGVGGGLIGMCGTNTSISVPAEGLTITGTVTSNVGAAGGVVGVLENPTIELPDFTVSANVKGVKAGGIVGEIQGGKSIIKDVTVSGTITGTEALGGVIGSVINAAAVELQGGICVETEITTTATAPHMAVSPIGTIIGKQEGSLIYFSEVGARLADGTAVAEENIGKAIVEREIGTYGGIFRNQSVGNGKLIGDGTIENVGTVNNTITVDGTGWYQLTSEADFETLAIALNTDGAFGTSAFGTGISSYDLRTASYIVTSNVDISYEKTGILTLDKNKGDASFCGKMKGANSNITIKQSSAVRQRCTGLFSAVGGDAYFSNLVLAGEIQHANGVGGLAFQIDGGSLTLENIVAQKKFSLNDSQIGGVIARKHIGNEFSLKVNGLTLASTIDAGSKGNYSGFITQLSRGDVDIDGITLGGTLKSTCSSEVGGFLGKSWSGIQGTIKNISVQSGTEYQSYASFGGLWYYLDSRADKGGYITLDTVTLNGLKVTASANKPNCALLVYKATNLVANIIDYDSTGCTVNNPGPNFDEVAGMTRSDQNRPLVGKSGIISLHSSANDFPVYHYENNASYYVSGVLDETVRTNNKTIYFYDVFQKLENADGTVNTTNQISGNVLDNSANMLLWNVVQMANGNLIKTFDRYFTDGTAVANESYTFSGTLDLSNISFYPVPYADGSNVVFTGTNDARIIFGAETGSVDMSEWELSNIQKNGNYSQHFGLHAGLFYNDLGHFNLQISDVTLAGTLSNPGVRRTGAIMTGEVGLTGGGAFTNITLDDLWVADYNGEIESALLVSVIAANTVTFDGIKMINYPEASSTKKAAGALIGYAGGENVENLVLRFTNMVIADDVNGSVKHNGDVLQYASFIYHYDYTDNTEINKGSGIYLFSEADADSSNNNVTFGVELDETTEFMDTSNLVLSSLSLTATDYKPYVYKEKKIEVNPKTGDILKGCGTYEDPYLIENEKQFLTLFRYINERELTETNTTYQYDTFYSLGDGWKIIKPGTDSDDDFCATKHGVTWNGASFTNVEGYTGSEDAVRYGDANFPTPEELSRAYYRLEKDIDLSAIKSETYKIIAEEFVGFGIAERPFTGVWYGKGTDGNIHTITLPDKTNELPSTNYGFIQYAQGAVVKDMNIKTSQNSAASIDANKTAKVSGAGGGVIATILGGDNIIDNVTVGVDLVVSSADINVGGYVGVVKKGGLILRNVKDTSLATFRLDLGAHDVAFKGAIVGKVEDGYVIYEGAGSTADSYIWSGQGGNTTITDAVSNYQILNGDKLKEDAKGLSVEKDDTKIVFTIPNAEALQVMSMALNADALNVRPSDYIYDACGYTELSRSRKADYSAIGCNDKATEDYLAAVKYDNVMGYSTDADKAYAYPYLYDYMGITEASYLTYFVEDGAEAGYSLLNPAGKINSTAYLANWELATDSSYDMSQFGESFRGIGAIYQTGGEFGGTFHGNFDGNGSTITLAMEREVLGTDANIDTIRRIGLFNILYGCDESSGNSIYNTEKSFDPTDEAVVEGSAAKTSRYCFTIENFKIAGSIDVSTNSLKDVDIGGVVGEIVDGHYVFSDISVDSANPLKIGEVGYEKIDDFGGIVGSITGVDSDSDYDYGYVLIQNCNFSGTAANPIVLNGLDAGGGFVGYADAEALKIISSQVQYVKVCSEEYAGGMVGEAHEDEVIFEGTDEATPIMVNNCEINGRKIGGFVGRTNKGLYIKYAKCENSKIGWDVNNDNEVKSAGGFVGEAEQFLCITYSSSSGHTFQAHDNMGGMVAKTLEYDSKYKSIIDNVQITNLIMDEQEDYSDIAGIGGIVGNNEFALTIQNATVSGTKNADGSYNFRIEGEEDKERTKTQGVGGIVGYHTTNILTLDACTVDTVSMTTDMNSTGTNTVVAGGLVGYVGGKVAMLTADSMKTSNLIITVPKFGEAKADVMAAGGCFGFAGARISTSSDSQTDVAAYYDGLSVTNNIITGRQAGGVIGYAKGQFRLSGVSVNGGSMISDEAAGGVVGTLYLENNMGFNPNESLTDEPVNTVSGASIQGRYAGGFIGRLALGTVYGAGLRAENLNITENEIWGICQNGYERCAGGVIGIIANGTENDQTLKLFDVNVSNNDIVVETPGDTLTAEEVNLISAGGVIGRLNIINGKGKRMYMDGISVASDNRIGIRKTGTTDIKLVRGITNNDSSVTYRLADLEMPILANNADGSSPTYLDAVEKLEQEYGYCVGSMIGMQAKDCNKLFYLVMVCSDEKPFVTPVMNENSPVVDAGRYAGGSVNDYRANYHIVYGAQAGDADDYSKNLAYMKAEVEKARTAYVAGSMTWSELLTTNRATDEEFSTFEKAYQASYLSDTGETVGFPLLVYRVQDGTAQAVMTDIMNVMTNEAANPACCIKNVFIKISATPKLYNGTEILDAPSGTVSSIAVSRTSQQTTTFTRKGYDSIENGVLSFTEITVTYGTVSDGVNVKTFKIPVFVEEPILYSVHSKIIEGKVTDVATIKNGKAETNETLIMANDSDYTMLVEYSYGSARKQVADSVTVDKVFYLSDESPIKEVPVGTQLLLIDVSNKNKAYYYEVKQAGIEKIRFTDFKDSAGNSFTNKPVNSVADVTDVGQSFYTDLAGHELTEVGVETFILTVLTNNTNAESNLQYATHVGVTDLHDSFMLRDEEHKAENVWNINSIPGLKVALTDKGTDTDIAGSLSKAEGITVKAEISITANDTFWQEKKKGIVMDSANSGKYLDVAFYLQDEKGTRVNWPMGTNFSYKTNMQSGTYSSNKVVPEEAVFYYYKDIRNEFNIVSEYEMGNIMGNTTQPIEFKLDFSGADMSTITEKKYEAWIELLRTANKEYPMGNGNMVDSYSEDVEASTVQEFGFALKADDLEDLAINTYFATNTQDSIPAHAMFDFSEILKTVDGGAGQDVVINKWSQLEYEVTYQIYKKVKSGETTTYIPYEGEYEGETYIGDAISINVVQADNNVVSSAKGSLTMTYEFSADEMEAGTDGVEGLISRPIEIVQNTKTLVDGNTGNLTNYKVLATLVIKENGVSSDAAEETSDFFVYTVTKLKTDF